ncbi:uncharacterized protein [Nicotiana tomentosiformis]|uniref:uncharacterized protein n=1 Tax=Nicotiana tomentosiformis TaxID=4098 RepID=UPI00388C8723
MAIGESDEETEISVIYLKDKIKLLSKERLSKLLIKLIDESEDVNNEKEQLPKECVILKAKCKNLKLRVSETISKNVVLKNQVQVKGNNQIWYMDSGCSKHMTGSKNQFLSLDDLKGGNVSFGNGKKSEIIGVGKVGKTNSHSIENVYLTDGLKYSLISVSQLCDRGKIVNNIYVVYLSTLSENELTCLSVLANDPLLWHKRLGHANLSELNKLVSKDLVIGLPNIKFKENKVCEACARGKQSSHPIENIITDPTSGIKTRSSLKNLCAFDAFLSLIEHKNVVEALQDAD